MSTKIIYTDVFRVSYPWLVSAQEPQKAGDSPKFGLSMQFPKNGICPANGQPSSYANIELAIKEVCAEAFNGWDYSFAAAPQMGIQFPPNFKDGDLVLQKDAAGNPVPNTIAPESAGTIILSTKNVERIGCTNRTLTGEIDPKEIYGGCYARAQLEVSAYSTTNNGTQVRVIVVKCLNLMFQYDGERFDNRVPAQAAVNAFAGMAVQDNLGETINAAPITAVTAMAGAITPPIVQPVVTQPVQPAITPPIVQPVITHPVVTPPVITPPVVTPPATGNVIMNAGLDYQAHLAAGHTDETLVAQGLAKPANFLNPAA